MKTIGIDISVLSDRQRTGIANYCYYLTKALLELNKKDHFILFGIATLDTYQYLKNLEFKKYPNVSLKIYKMPAKFFRTAFMLWQEFEWPPIENFIGPVDIFHSYNWYLPPQKSGKKVATVFDLTTLLYPDFHDPKTVSLDTIRLNRIKKGADLVITISKNGREDFLKFAPANKVEVIYPTASFKSGKIASEVKRVFNKYHLSPGYILSVSTLEPRKNTAGLIKAYLQSGLKNKLVLAGKIGWKNSSVLQLIEKNQDRIILTGFVEDEDLPILYNQAVCFVYPSFYEGFGIPILEAMSTGAPVITSKISSLPEVGGGAVYYIDPFDVGDIKRALVEVVENKNVRKNLIKMGLKQVKKFSWITSARKLNLLYQRL